MLPDLGCQLSNLQALKKTPAYTHTVSTAISFKSYFK